MSGFFPPAVLLALLAAAPAPAQELEICTWHQVIVGQARDLPRRVDLVTVIYRAPEGSPWAGPGFAEGSSVGDLVVFASDEIPLGETIEEDRLSALPFDRDRIAGPIRVLDDAAMQMGAMGDEGMMVSLGGRTSKVGKPDVFSDTFEPDGARLYVTGGLGIQLDYKGSCQWLD